MSYQSLDPGRDDAVVSLVVSTGTGRAVWAASATLLRVRDLGTGRVTTIDRTDPAGHVGTAVRLGFATDPKRVWVACDDGVAEVWNLESGTRVGRRMISGAHPLTVAFDPSGRWLAESAAGPLPPQASGGLYISDLDNDKSLGRNALFDSYRGWCSALALTHDASRLVVADSKLAVLDLRSCFAGRAVLGKWKIEGSSSAITALAVDPSGRRVVSGGVDGNVALWDLEQRTSFSLGSQAHAIHDVAISESGRLAATTASDGAVILWDLEQRILLGATRREAAATACAFAGEDCVMIGDASGQVIAWNAA